VLRKGFRLHAFVDGFCSFSGLKHTTNMTIPIYIAGVAVLGFFLYKLLYGTDTPHIKGLPEVPGLPLFGSLFELGTNHAKVAQGWAKKYGPVFQVRMGNRVRQVGSKW
jgi:hypothetical protein